MSEAIAASVGALEATPEGNKRFRTLVTIVQDADEDGVEPVAAAVRSIEWLSQVHRSKTSLTN